MAHMQIFTEMPRWLLQAKDFLVEARRLKPRPARNELRFIRLGQRGMISTQRDYEASFLPAKQYHRSCGTWLRSNRMPLLRAAVGQSQSNPAD
jgi:hypothetical protein